MSVPIVKLRAREDHTRRSKMESKVLMIVEVELDGKIIGQIPATRAVYEMLPNSLGKLTVECLVERAEIETFPPA